MSAILDPDEDKYLPLGEMGEIVSWGPQVTLQGYWKREDATKCSMS